MLDFAGAGDHKKLMPTNLKGILGVAKSCLIEISEHKMTRINSNSGNWNLGKGKAMTFRTKLTSLEIRLSMLKSSLVLTEANFMERNCMKIQIQKPN